MNKKQLIATILSNICKWLPIVVYGCFNIESFYSTADKGITISAIILLGAVLCYFKDSFAKGLKSPSTFKYVIILGIMSLIFIVLGEQIFTITSILLGSFLAAMPFDAWRSALNEERVDDDVLNKLKEFLNKK